MNHERTPIIADGRVDRGLERVVEEKRAPNAS